MTTPVFGTAQLQPPAGFSYVNLNSGDQLLYDNLGGELSVAADGTPTYTGTTEQTSATEVHDGTSWSAGDDITVGSGGGGGGPANSGTPVFGVATLQPAAGFSYVNLTNGTQLLYDNLGGELSVFPGGTVNYTGTTNQSAATQVHDGTSWSAGSPIVVSGSGGGGSFAGADTPVFGSVNLEPAEGFSYVDLDDELSSIAIPGLVPGTQLLYPNVNGQLIIFSEGDYALSGSSAVIVETQMHAGSVWEVGPQLTLLALLEQIGTIGPFTWAQDDAVTVDLRNVFNIDDSDSELLTDVSDVGLPPGTVLADNRFSINTAQLGEGTATVEVVDNFDGLMLSFSFDWAITEMGGPPGPPVASDGTPVFGDTQLRPMPTHSYVNLDSGNQLLYDNLGGELVVSPDGTFVYTGTTVQTSLTEIHTGAAWFEGPPIDVGPDDPDPAVIPPFRGGGTSARVPTRPPRVKNVNVRSLSKAISGPELPFPVYKFSRRQFFEQGNHRPFIDAPSDDDNDG